MSNAQGVKVQRIEKGKYKVDGWEVWDVPGTTGWRVVSPNGKTSRWFPTLTKAKQFIARHSG